MHRSVRELSFVLCTLMLFGITPNYFAQSVYTQNGGTSTKTNETFSSSTTDESPILVKNSGVLTLTYCTISSTGNSSSTDNSSKVGLNAAVLANTSGKVTLIGGSINTTGSGANGLFATGSGSSITMSDGTITCVGGNAHGVDVTYTGTINLKNVTIKTSGGSSSGVATDFGGGTVNVTGGSVTVSGSKSAGIYSTGNITVNDATVTATNDNGAVIDADGIINLSNTNLSGSKNGLMLHNTVGQSSLVGVATIAGGSFEAKGGDAFYVNGAKATLTVKNGTSIKASSGNIVNATANGNAIFKADNISISGNLIADATSTLNITLQNNSTLTGAIQKGALTLDASSKWNLTANSVLTTLSNSSGISGTAVTNITGNGFNVYYNPSLSGNSVLGGNTFSLVNGGQLVPQNSSDIETTSYELPHQYSLLQNYPNPFNPETLISYQISANSRVSLKVYDALGKEIATLVDEYKSPGFYNSKFNILHSSLSSGLYFYILRVLDESSNITFSDVKKMVLVK